jgi:hypothetical protein
MHGLIALEFNEVNRAVLERMIAAGKLPNFSRLLQTHRTVETVADEEYQNLEPWIQWVTVHTGKTQAEHGAFNLSDVQHKNLEQIWDVLERRGVACGVVSPMNARRGALTKGFFIPDPWSVSHDAHPAQAVGIYDFIADKVRSHNVTLEKGRSKLAFVADCLKIGLPLSSLGRLGLAYIRARLNPKLKWRLPAEMDEFLFAVTLTLRRKFKTKYTSVFMNSVAHYQHHYWTSHDPGYWGEKYPALFAQRNPVAERNLRSGDDPIEYGMRMFDRVLGRAVEAAGAESVMVITGLSQVPFVGYENQSGFYLYRPRDHEALLSALGVFPERIAPLMSRDAMLYFASEAGRTAARLRLQSAHVDGHPVFLCTEEDELRLFVKVSFTWHAADNATIEAEGVAPGSVRFSDHLLLITFKTGHHSKDGLLLAPKSVLGGVSHSMPLPLRAVPSLIFKALDVNEAEQMTRELLVKPA